MVRKLTKLALQSALVLIVVAAVVATLKLTWVLVVTHPSVDSMQGLLRGVAALPIAVGIHALLSVAYFGAPIFIGSLIYASYAASRPVLWRMTRWLPASLAVALVAVVTGHIVYGTSWSFFAGWGAASEHVSSVIIGVGMSVGTFVALRRRVGRGDADGLT